MRAIARAIWLAVLVLPVAALAQHSPGITDEEMLGPWQDAAAALGRLQVGAAGLAVALGQLDAELAKLQTQLEDTAVYIVARPEFSYDAAQWSEELSRQVGKSGEALEAVFAAVGTSDEARTACDEIAQLQATLAQRVRFERDVLFALGSGSKNVIQALARRWWMVSESVEDVREAAGRLASSDPGVRQ
jgi:hypothetical protein